MRAAWFLPVASMVGGLAACGLGLQGLEDVTSDAADGSTDEPSGSGDSPDSISAEDSSSHGDPDGGIREAGAVDTGPPCTLAAGCYVIPPGWQLAAVAGDRSSACPQGFAARQPTDLDEGPDASNACICACTVAEEPTCPTGPIAVSLDQLNSPGAGLCGQAAPPLGNVPAGMCDTDIFYPSSSYPALDLQYTPPASVGGQCSGVATGNGNVTYSTQARACLPDNAQSAGCIGNGCTPTLAAPYRACIVQTGIQSCPDTSFTDRHLVGSGVSFGCSACGCSLTATCVGTMQLFTDQDCTQQELDIPADGQCHDPSAPNNAYGSYVYVSSPPQDDCTTTTPSTAQDLALQNEETLCCVP